MPADPQVAPATPPAAMPADPQVAPATSPATTAGDDALRDLRESCGLRQAFTSANGVPVWRSRTPAVDAPGIDALLGLGVRRVWDLRAESERAVAPAVRIPGARVSVPDEPLYVVMRAGVGTRATRPATGPHDVPSLPGLADATLARQLREGDLGRQRPGERMANIYASMAEHVEALVPAVHALAFATEPTLVFCSSGKDRTGVFSALLLGLCGVDQRDIIGDYTLSMVNLRPFYEQMPLPNEEVGKNKKLMYTGFYRTGPDTMEGLLDHFKEKYGGVEGYVRACGVSDAVIQRIREKFIEPGE